MALFKKKENKPIEDVKPEVSKNTREVEGLEDIFVAEPEIQELPIEEPVHSLLEDKPGVFKSIKVNELAFVKNAVPTKELIVRKKNDKYELIGLGNIEVKVIEGSDQEISIMLLDYMVKHGDIPESKKLEIYKYEMANSDFIKTLTGKNPAELNGFSDEYFASLVIKNDIDERLKELPVDALIEASKLSKDVQNILGNIVSKVGSKKISADAIKSLQGIAADETTILMRLLQF